MTTKKTACAVVVTPNGKGGLKKLLYYRKNKSFFLCDFEVDKQRSNPSITCESQIYDGHGIQMCENEDCQAAARQHARIVLGESDAKDTD